MIKVSKFAFFGICALFLLFSACYKDNDPGDGNSGTVRASELAAGQVIVKARLSGSYHALYESVISTSAIAKSDKSIFIMSARQYGDSTGIDQFIIFLPADIQRGNYHLQNIESRKVIFKYAHAGEMWSVPAAQTSAMDPDAFGFTISTNSQTVLEGTFQGSMTNDADGSIIQVKGSFAARYSDA